MLIKESQEAAQACVIWMHGLGAGAQDMFGLASELVLSVPVKHVCLDAPVRPVTLNNGMAMPAWYDILGMELADREDQVGILESEQLIQAAVEEQLEAGFDLSRIILAGFSQGGAMALFAGLRYQNLAGIVALSSYLPLRDELVPTTPKGTPIFLAAGLHDPIVLPKWSRMSRDWILEKGYQDVVWNEYPMEHAVCHQEIQDLSSWLSNKLRSGV